MTREEAHRILSNGLVNAPSEHEWCMAFDMAIKALEQEPCEDAISRQALLKLMGEEPFNWTDSDKELQAVEDYRNFRNMVEQLPPIKPQEPKTGHWIKYGKLYQCSKCKELSCCQGKFCNECGIKMVETQEGSK